MAEFKISRLRYTWRGLWTTTTAYNKDDVVRYGGTSYVCIRQHTSSSFRNDQLYVANINDTDPSPAWIKMTDGYAFRDEWSDTTVYAPGDIVKYGGNLYLCIEAHTSGSTFDENSSKFSLFTHSYNWNNAWTQNTRYGINDIVRYGGFVYRCYVEHTSSTTSNGLEFDSDKWTPIIETLEYVGPYTQNTRYKPNDLILYGGSLLKCITGHTAGANINSSYFETEFPGYNFYNEWDDMTYYAIGDIVKHGGYLYRANINNHMQSPGESLDQPVGSPTWTIISKGYNFAGIWNSQTDYKTGDVVRRGGNLYIALLDTVGDGSSLDYLDSSNWEILAPGNSWRGSWAEDESYAVGDIVHFEGSAFRSNREHTSNSENFPGDNGSGFEYWDIYILEGDYNVGMNQRGDLLTYGLSRRRSNDESTLGATRVDIGNNQELLSINSNGDPYYKVWGNVDKVIYVSSDERIAADDLTDPNRGINPFRPFRTVRFACEYVESLGTAGELTTIKVLPGYYEEICPIIVPKLVAIRGDELRSVTIVPNEPIEALANDADYSIAALERIKAILPDIFLGNPVNKSIGNTEDQIAPEEEIIVNIPFVPPQYDQNGNEIFQGSSISTVTLETSFNSRLAVLNLIDDIIEYIDYYINSEGVGPTTTGSNTATTNMNFENVADILELNKEFIAAEAAAFTRQQFPAYQFDSNLCKRDMRRFVDAWKYDVIYTGNYKSLLAARYYRNAVLGSVSEDMFYLRDATGLRNCTLKGLTGSLNPVQVNELYRRPTGGAFCSLDPGWGPNDERVWINTRSPYVQNVTTFGYGSVGQKIDGALHNGGNKSIVSNDFTQVISDGIGAWVLNGGRAELVSVFTYYAQIGMFAEDGGIIRATNGNSSYGDFGAVADGNDPNETPRFATVNTRANQAIISAAFAGEVNDEILALEFANAGSEYTFANYTFVGSGINASVVQEEFRDNAIFEAQVRNNPEAQGGTPGGGGYSVIGNNAQAGTSTTITLASNDENSEANLLGLRIIITSGDGTGQYGYVSAYNSTTKVLTVRKESDDTLGWDHVVPGTPILNSLTTNATYRLEPRITFSAPTTTFSAVTLAASTSWSEVTYGETTETYNNIEATAGTGETIDVVPATAFFNVVKNGRSYDVSLVSGGAGYEANQILTIPGSEVGGIDSENDVTIYVKTVSDDSTNSILTFTYEGIAQSGRFVIVPDSGNSAVASTNGEDWVNSTLPTNRNWKALAAGNGRFVTIANNSNSAAYSYDGITWTASTMPSSRNWNAVAYGSPSTSNDKLFVAVADNLNSGAYSTNGITWTATTLPTVGDSTLNNWVDIAYGKNRWVAIANSGNVAAYATWNGTSLSWTGTIMDTVADSSAKDWVSVAYGNNRFVAISNTGDIGYSFDGATWYAGGSLPTQDGSTSMSWKKIRYGQGVFFAVCDTGSQLIGNDPTTGPTEFCATSYDGIQWTPRTTGLSLSWKSVAFGNPDITLGDSTASNSRPMFIAISSDVTSTALKVFTGARALGRVSIETGRITEVKLWEPGSGYTSDPTITVYDPNNTSDVFVLPRLGDGALAQPSWLNRGTNYKTSSTSVTVIGDGYADIIPVGNRVTLSGLTVLPGPGTQFRFKGEVASYYTVASIELDSQQLDGTFTAIFRIGPNLTSDYNLEHNTQCEIREFYSQVRITGHDFLDVGTGNFVETNYPELYASAQPFNYAPENEVVELNGGRVFYTSTDQNGNFRTGELFAVEQATGIVTISADFFDLQGLTELALGGVRLGGSGAVIREFSTDPLFTADSNNVVPTQRAIKAYLQNRLNVGGSDLLTASFIAGTVLVGPNLINNSASLGIVIPVQADFSGPNVHISGSYIAQQMFMRARRY